jgi:hypothetical protein
MWADASRGPETGGLNVTANRNWACSALAPPTTGEIRNMWFFMCGSDPAGC